MKARYLAVALLLTLALIGPAALAQASGPQGEAAVKPEGILWQIDAAYGAATLVVAGPGEWRMEREFAAGEPLYWPAHDDQGAPWPDGGYTYELRLSPALDAVDRAARQAASDEGRQGDPDADGGLAVVSGHFTIQGGAIVSDQAPEPTGDADQPKLSGAHLNDQVIADDLIVAGSHCVGFDCVNNESFSFDTIRLKENNLQIHFDDTSSSAGFPYNDWRIVANDSISGGASYLTIEDSTAGRRPFKIMAGARANSLLIDSAGRLGLGTATPVLRVHVAYGDTPGVRLDQDGTAGWRAQVWDVAGNEANFFVRDVTGGSKLPFRIQPGAPTNSLTVKNSGYVGLGTWSPGANLEVQTAGADSSLWMNRTDGAMAVMTASENDVQIGALSSHPVRFISGEAVVGELDGSGNLRIKGRLTQNYIFDAATAEPAENEASLATSGSLAAQLAAQEERISQLEAENQALADRLAALEALLAERER